ncbi:calcium-binding protein, partial [Rhizobiaceae sp. 2RAB30]
MIGSTFNDRLYGDAGNNYLNGRTGADYLDGGGGIDLASYYDSNAGVTVNLATGKGSGGHAQGDVLLNIENLVGSRFADKLYGDAGNNVLTGGAGADYLDGGPGSDTASYSSSNAGVIVDLRTGKGSGGHAQGDTLVSIGNLTGSN